MNRRTILKGGVILAATAHTAASAPTFPDRRVSIDDFLAKALPSEKARYHANALAEAMNELHPGQYIVRLKPDAGFAFVVDQQPAEGPKRLPARKRAALELVGVV